MTIIEKLRCNPPQILSITESKKLLQMLQPLLTADGVYIEAGVTLYREVEFGPMHEKEIETEQVYTRANWYDGWYSTLEGAKDGTNL